MQNNSNGLADAQRSRRQPAEERAARVQELNVRQLSNESPLRKIEGNRVPAFVYGLSLARSHQNVTEQSPFATPSLQSANLRLDTKQSGQSAAPIGQGHSTGAKPQAGLMTAFSNTCYRWKLPPELHLTLLGLGDDRSLGNQILYGVLKPPRDVRARASCVIAISLGLGALFRENLTAELDWLETANERLTGRSPLAFMLDGDYLNLFAARREVERMQGLT